MKTITNHWVDYYLETMKHSFWMLTDNRTLTTAQKDKVKKTVQSFLDKIKTTER